MTRSPQSAQHPSAAGIGAMLLAAAVVVCVGCEDEPPPAATEVAPQIAGAEPAPQVVDADSAADATGAQDPTGEQTADADAPESPAPDHAGAVARQPTAEPVAVVEAPSAEPTPSRQPTATPTPTAKPAPAADRQTATAAANTALAPQPSVPRPSADSPEPAATKRRLSGTPAKKPMGQLTPREKRIVIAHRAVAKQVAVLEDLADAKTELRDSLGYLQQAVRILRGPAREEAEAVLDEVRAALAEFDALHRDLSAEASVALEETERGLPPGY